MPSEPPNNPLKLPFFVVLAVVGLALVAVGLVGWGRGGRILSIFGLVVLTLALPAIRMIRSARNPWWIWAPLANLPG
jgi:hypothetical protein